MQLRKHELVVVCRAKGWKGSESRLPAEYFTRWLDERNVPMSERLEIVRRFKSGQVGGNGEQRDATKGLSQQEVLEMIERAFQRDTAVNDEEKVKQWIAEAVAARNPDKIVVDTAASIKQQVAIIEGTHPLFEKVLKLVVAGLNVLLVGPAGCGKTTMAHMIAKALKRKFGMLSCTAGASESQLTGWLLPVEANGKFAYVPSEFVDLYEEGGSVFLFDEFDAADPNMLLVINSALANGSLHVPQRYKKPHVTRGKNVAMIAAANTYGTGADMIYAGRNQLDAATLDRFYVVEMDYDKELERRIGLPEVTQWVWELREKVKQHRIRRVVSTRSIIKMSTAIRAGIDFNEAKRDALSGWTRDELSKVNEVFA